MVRENRMDYSLLDATIPSGNTARMDWFVIYLGEVEATPWAVTRNSNSDQGHRRCYRRSNHIVRSHIRFDSWQSLTVTSTSNHQKWLSLSLYLSLAFFFPRSVWSTYEYKSTFLPLSISLIILYINDQQKKSGRPLWPDIRQYLYTRSVYQLCYQTKTSLPQTMDNLNTSRWFRPNFSLLGVSCSINYVQTSLSLVKRVRFFLFFK